MSLAHDFQCRVFPCRVFLVALFRSLNLSGNPLTGTVPIMMFNLTALTQLTSLDISSCSLTGSIASTYIYLSSLQYVLQLAVV